MVSYMGNLPLTRKKHVMWEEIQLYFFNRKILHGDDQKLYLHLGLQAPVSSS